jgi:hypothetical protein
MTNEEKFKQLLEIAARNSFDINELPHLLKTCLRFKFKIKNLDVISESFNCIVSLNDLVLNTNFFECLFKNYSIRKYFNSNIVNTNPEINNITVRFDYKDDFVGFGCPEKNFVLNSFSNTAVQFKKFQWVLEVEKGTALEWLFKQFNL